MINIGKAVYSIISGVTFALVAGGIYPLEIPENTPQPLIVYERTTTREYSRDGGAWYNSTVTFYVLTNKYSDGIDIGALVIGALDNYKGKVQGINIVDCRLNSIDETVNDQIFTQRLEFNIKNF
jgi:hypothetical protein